MKIKKTIEMILRDIPATRANDNLLFAEVLRRIETAEAPDNRAELIDSFSHWRGIQYDSVRRTRQRVQELHPELKPSAEAQKRRSERTERVLADLYEP